ncbi:Galactosyltransferase [Handroanthus impetiginosus]|uniref:Galactosyltransferase n=1 Tax=Handroanthus impetiginosus TaxID=429701 RepID=A0A2G9GJ56_9LAMI|nr:Galactosyltransferase [Handroanthus impetiginosus]
MSSVSAFAAKPNSIVKQGSCFPSRLSRKICNSLIISAIFLYIIYIFLSNHPYKRASPDHFIAGITSPTNISHFFFGIAASSNTWSNKRFYVQSWWRPNATRGLLFMDKSPVQHLPWPSPYPPFRVSEDNSRYEEYNKHAMPFAIRMVRVIEETFKEEHDEGVVRWYVMADDDTVLLIDNLVEVLSKYDHRKYFYVGMKSECIVSNSIHSFEMGFGGAGYALSYPLAKVLAQNMDLCIKRYPTLFGSDHILQSCIADLGVSLTQEKGFHQIDLHRDISGLLSAHPHSPFLSLHHLDAVEPIFPSMNRIDSLNHLMKAAAIDQSRLLQQTICYYNKNNWTFSVSWGYSVQIYDFGSKHGFVYKESCIADLGVSLTQEKGFHQIDLHRDISGLLSAHPHSPFLSLHHLDAVEPIFPSMNRIDSLNHLMKAAAIDQSRLLQQTICYYNKNNWTFSVSWGYSVQIYDNIFPPSYLYRPLETFIPWKKGATLPYMFNTRVLSTDPCEAPHFFFFVSVDEKRVMDHIVTSYTRRSPRGLPACISSGNHSADFVSKVRVLSPLKNLGWEVVGMDSLAIKLRNRMNDEIVA